MKVFDSELTDRGSERKVIYTVYDVPDKKKYEARLQARKDFNEHKRQEALRNRTETIKPWKQKRYNTNGHNWLVEERMKIATGISDHKECPWKEARERIDKFKATLK